MNALACGSGDSAAAAYSRAPSATLEATLSLTISAEKHFATFWGNIDALYSHRERPCLWKWRFCHRCFQRSALINADELLSSRDNVDTSFVKSDKGRRMEAQGAWRLLTSPPPFEALHWSFPDKPFWYSPMLSVYGIFSAGEKRT